MLHGPAIHVVLMECGLTHLLVRQLMTLRRHLPPLLQQHLVDLVLLHLHALDQHVPHGHELPLMQQRLRVCQARQPAKQPYVMPSFLPCGQQCRQPCACLKERQASNLTHTHAHHPRRRQPARRPHSPRCPLQPRPPRPPPPSRGAACLTCLCRVGRLLTPDLALQRQAAAPRTQGVKGLSTGLRLRCGGRGENQPIVVAAPVRR
jgi:hypothetical protein